ncbi:hypothetical protein BT96DRAFT_1007860 [Gymnopus androsaceus JB14]|uniref:Uncharacterized protein n=1 Tax=Gymnopus androsaceus JB14 TaxID=1447944 RepID=A0A6A4GH94_9AGAR|nr:hypothetical protein BT96DRAFT_1007860 [Gymnopus androsaceus JB14]
MQQPLLLETNLDSQQRHPQTNASVQMAHRAPASAPPAPSNGTRAPWNAICAPLACPTPPSAPPQAPPLSDSSWGGILTPNTFRAAYGEKGSSSSASGRESQGSNAAHAQRGEFFPYTPLFLLIGQPFLLGILLFLLDTLIALTQDPQTPEALANTSQFHPSAAPFKRPYLLPTPPAHDTQMIPTVVHAPLEGLSATGADHGPQTGSTEGEGDIVEDNPMQDLKGTWCNPSTASLHSYMEPFQLECITNNLVASMLRSGLKTFIPLAYFASRFADSTLKSVESADASSIILDGSGGIKIDLNNFNSIARGLPRSFRQRFIPKGAETPGHRLALTIADMFDGMFNMVKDRSDFELGFEAYKIYIDRAYHQWFTFQDKNI